MQHGRDSPATCRVTFGREEARQQADRLRGVLGVWKQKGSGEVCGWLDVGGEAVAAVKDDSALSLSRRAVD